MTREQYIENIKERLNQLTKDELKDVSILTAAQLGVRQKLAEKERIENEITNFKSQLDSQQPEIPEVPQFVADWLDRKPLYAINGSIPVDIIAWSKKQTGYADLGMIINLLLKLKVNGYTVAKEKRFYLKNKLTGLYLALHTEENRYYEHHYDCALKNQEGWKYKFTQQEIDSMETGSYEPIPAEGEA